MRYAPGMDDYAANRWAKAAIQAWLNADPKRTKVRFVDEMNMRIPGSTRTKQFITKINRVPEDGGAKPRRLRPEEIQAIEAITGATAPVLVTSAAPALERDALRRAIILVHAMGPDLLRDAGISDDEWQEIAGGHRPLTDVVATRLSEASGAARPFITEGDWSSLTPDMARRLGAAASQLLAI